MFSHTPAKVPKVNSKYRSIQTLIPTPETVAIIKELSTVESVSMHGQLPVLWDKAEGFQVSDAYGNTWIDFTSTIFVANAGHAQPLIIKALEKQLAKPLIHAYTYPTKIRLQYLKKLIQISPDNFEKAFLLSSGTEATECAFKLMRLWGQNNSKKRLGIMGFEGNWHGRTLGAQMMSANQSQKEWIGYSDPDIHHLPFPYPWRQAAMNKPKEYFLNNIKSYLELNHLNAKEDICGFMIETFQGWSACFYPKAFMQALEIFAKENNILIAFDEMQSGFARTGKWFGYMHYGVQPDLICCGKGASSGYPLSFVLGSRDLLDLPAEGSMSSTHSANPLACAAGLANIEAIETLNLVEETQRKGKLFHQHLNKIKEQFPDLITRVEGKGLLAAIYCKDTELANDICEKSMQKGLLLVHTGRETIKLAPPLVIPDDAIEEGLSVLSEIIKNLKMNPTAITS